MTAETNQSDDPPPHTSARMYWFLIPPAVVVVISVSALLGAFEIALLVGLIGIGILLVGYGRDGWAPGPLFFFDLMRLARRGRGTVLRCVYAVALSVGLCVVYVNEFSWEGIFDLSGDAGPRLTLPELARFAEHFMLVVVSLQSVAVILLTPSYLAGAIAEEKEQKTLELLFTTQLSDRQIVIGKMLARLTHLVGVLLTGLPILSLTQLFGGVSAELLLCHFFVAGLTLLSVGSISILCSVQAKTVLGAMVASYFVVIVMNLGCLCPPCFFFVSPFGFGFAHEQGMFPIAPRLIGTRFTYLPLLVPYALVHGGLAWLCLVPAVRGLRRHAGVGSGKSIWRAPVATLVVPAEFFNAREPIGPDERTSSKTSLTQKVPTKKSALAQVLDGDAPPVTDHPLLWKEVYHGASGFGRQLGTSLVLILFLAFAATLFVGMLASLHGGLGALRASLNPPLRVLISLLGAVACMGAGVRAAGSVARERAQKTLQTLLLLPIERWEVLGAKWLGSILRLRYVAYFFGAVVGLGLMTGAFHPVAVVFIAVTFALHITFAAAVGLVISVYCRTTLASNSLMALFLFIWFVGSALLLLGTLPTWYRPQPGFAQQVLNSTVNPMRTYWLVGFAYDETLADHIRELASVFFGWFVYAGVGLLCWSVSCALLGGAAPRWREIR